MYKRNNAAIFLNLVLTCWIIIFIYHSSAYCGQGDNEKAYVPNEVLVKFNPQIEDIEKDSIRQSVGAALVNTIKSIGVEYWRLSEDISTEEAVEILNDMPSVEFAEPNYLYKPLTLPNDTHFNKLWFLHNTGQWVHGISGIPGADISAAEAWDIETGSHDVVIAVIDSGVAFDHPDLKNNVWVNTKEIPDNGIDDDGNGYIDDVHGRDFVNNDNNPSDYSRDMYCDGHGTHVAGIIAARGNNNLGVSGVMWQARIMPLQVFDLFEEAIIKEYNIALAVVYAVNNGAKIINMSLGGGHYSNTQYSVLNYADQNGVLVVAAAGNGGLDQIGDDNDLFPCYPASYDLPNIISVAATNELDELSSYSNHGLQSVDVAAPGGRSSAGRNIFSTTPPERVTLFYEDFECGLNQWVTNGIYEGWSIGYNWLFGSNVARDSIYGYHENELSYLRMANPVDATNCRGLHLELKIGYDLEDGYDYCFIEGSLDGINYFDSDYPITGFSDGIISYREWYSELELGKFYLGLRLETDWLYNYSGVSIDNIKITGIPWVFEGDEYDYKSGTSMATPVVSGIAGLVWSHNPNLTHHEVRSIILDSVDKLESLDGRILTGGRVNAYKALMWIYQEGDWVSISGDITTQDGTPVCAMALANGQYMFSCNPTGKCNLSVPLDENGQVTLFAFADGFAPLKYIFTPEWATEDIDVMMLRAPPNSRQMTLTCQFDDTAESPGWVRISGQARAENGGAPLCAMVLANGQYMFSNAGTGEYEMEIPLDENGQITLFGFADGFQPFKLDSNLDVMAAAAWPMFGHDARHTGQKSLRWAWK